MKFIVTLIALVIERFFDWSHLRQWHWYSAYQQAIQRRLPGKNAYLILAITIAPLVLITVILQFLLHNVLYGVIELVFQLLILLYCLGPRNLWADTLTHLHAESTDANKPVTTESSPALSTLFIAANKRVFAVVFWFTILGPAGALLYRALALSVATPETATHAGYLESLLDWIPARLFTFILALGGHFSNVFSCWRKNVLLGPSQNEALLTECGTAALGNGEPNTTAQHTGPNKSAVHLLDRAFVISLVLVLLIVLLV